MERMHWQDWVTLLAGIVLAAALFVVDITPPEGMELQTATWNFVIVGLAAIATAAAALYAYQAWAEWVALGLGLWMIVSPWVLGFNTIAVLMWLAVICGAVIAAMATFVLIEPKEKDLF